MSLVWSHLTASSITASSPEMNREQDTAELTGLCSGRLHQAGVTPAAGVARSHHLICCQARPLVGRRPPVL